ncbi:MAG: threonine dehydrogenase-like Zn-dependent dehydrogenase [Paracoccaceae bacterium]
MGFAQEHFDIRGQGELLIPCHEYTGLVVNVGADVTSVKVGDRVVVDPDLECGHCSACKRGWAHLWEILGVYGVTADGGFAEYSVMKASQVRRIGVAFLAEQLIALLLI